MEQVSDSLALVPADILSVRVRYCSALTAQLELRFRELLRITQGRIQDLERRFTSIGDLEDRSPQQGHGPHFPARKPGDRILQKLAIFCTLYCDVWCGVKDKKGREQKQRQRSATQTDCKFCLWPLWPKECRFCSHRPTCCLATPLWRFWNHKNSYTQVLSNIITKIVQIGTRTKQVK